MFCEKCGNRLNEGDHFCAVCGTAINKEEIMENAAPVIPKSTSYKRKMSVNEILAIIFVAVGMVSAVIGSIISATNHGNLQNAQNQLNSLQAQIDAAQNSILGNLMGDLSSLYQEALTQCQASVTHYKELVYGGIIVAVVGAVVAIGCVLYIFVFKKDTPITDNAPVNINIPNLPPENKNDVNSTPQIVEQEINSQQKSVLENTEEIPVQNTETE